MEIKIINRSNHPLPAYKTVGAAGMDLQAFISEEITIPPLGRKLIPTGLSIALPIGFEAQVRPRSGLSLKKGITVLNAPGTIDSDYRGDIGVILCNLGEAPFVVKNGDRIAQMVVSKYTQVSFNLVNELEETERGAGGFGHTGT